MATANSKNRQSSKQISWPLWCGIIYILIIAVGWVFESPTREELFGDTGKIWDLMRGPIGGWTPNFMLGHSLMTLQVAGWAVLFYNISVALLGPLIGALASIKLIALTYIAASGWTMYLFIRRLLGNRSIAQIGALFYIILPSMNVAIGNYEHTTVGLCFVFAPLILRGILTVAEESSPLEIVGLGLSAGALALSYTKIAIVMSPMLILWTIEVLNQNRSRLRAAIIGYGCSVLIASLTAVLILLPASREFGFSAGFLFDPLDGWQHHYAFKTPLLWIDLWGFLTNGGDQDLTGDAAMFQIGMIPLAGLTFALGLPALGEWRASSVGRWFLTLTACWLVSIWFAAGPDGILLGHLHVLKNVQNIPDAAIPILWLTLIWLGWLIYQTSFQLLKQKVLPTALVTLLVLAIPVFRIIEFFPLFKDVRAPESFWSVGGFCALAAAVGISFWVLFTEVIKVSWRRPFGLLVALLLIIELYPIYSAYWTRGMDPNLFEDYDKAAAFLKTAPLQGRVHPLSGRYFYLTLPEKTGRAIDTESLLRHFQLKWVRYLEAAGNSNSDAIRSYMNLAGVAYILIDKKDPFTPKQLQDFFRSIYQPVFDNENFTVLANSGTLYPAFLAHDFVALPPDSYAMAPAVLQLLPQNLVTVEMTTVDQASPGYAGMAKSTNQIELRSQFQGKSGKPFMDVPFTGNRQDDYQRMVYDLPPTASGWLVVSEAYHPDWTVSVDGKVAEVHRAEGAFLSTYVQAGTHEVVFLFKAPAWYSICLAVGMICWIVLLTAFLYLPSKYAPLQWREWWIGKRTSR